MVEVNARPKSTLSEFDSRTGGVFLFFTMSNSHLSPTLLAALGGCLFGLAIVLAATPLCAYGWAALAAYIALQLAAPLARSLYNNPQEEGGAL